MVESHGRNAEASPISPGAQQRLAFWVAGTICAIAIVLAALIALRTPQYEAQTRLAYSPGGTSASGSAATPAVSGAATAAANSLFTDAEMAQVIDRFDLYPELRHKQSTAALTSRLRENLVMSEPEPGMLQLAFKDADEAKATTVANGFASALASSPVMTSVSMATTDVPGKSKHPGRNAKKSYEGVSRLPAPPVLKAVPVPVVVAPSGNGGSNAAYVAELSHQVDRVDSALHDMQDARGELEAEQKQVASKIEALEKTERKAAEARGGNHAEAIRSERSVAEQDMAVEKAKLASLRERYTDAYPDVQSTQDDINKLQAKLASLPAPVAAGDKGTPTPDQAEAMEKLRGERQRVERDLDQNQLSVESETQRKLTLQAQMEQAKMRRPNPVSAQVAVTPAPAPAPAPVVAPPPTPLVADVPSQGTMMVPVLPFRVVETAGSGALVTTSRLALAVWLGIGTAVLLALCFVPMVPAHYAAVVTTPEDLQEGTPEHAVYLGDVGLGDVGLGDARRTEP